MKDLKAIKGRAYILGLIAEGEHVRQDFKYAISDARKIARSISAFANHSGGQLLIGVKDNGAIAGVKNEEDIYVVEQAGWMYCDPPQEIEFTAFSTGETGIVIRARVAEAAAKPVRVKEDGNRLRAYYRVADENISAHPLMVKAWYAQQDERPASFSLDSVESALLAEIRAMGSLSIDNALHLTVASRRTVEDAIVRLAAMGIIAFEHHSSGFALIAAAENE